MKRLTYIFACVMALGALFFSCSEEEQFTSSTSARLSFESDTVRFDTVFTTIGSSTKRFKVFNRNKDGIRINSIRLASGGASGFRINVDGHSGASLTDIEILKEDSLFIFADIIGKPKNEDSPILVRDSLIFHLESGKQQQIILEALGQDVVILKAKTIDSNTVFSANRPYLIYDSLIVAPNTTLTIPEGTTLCFHNRAYLGVYGKIVCNGSLEKQITFRGDRTDKIFSYLPYDRMDAQWGGITLYSSSGDNYFNYVDIHGGNWGIDCTTSLFVGTKFNIENSVIHNVKGFGLREYYIAGSVINSQITNAGNDCVNLIGGYVDFVHCTIAQLYPWDGKHGVALHFANVQDSIIYPLEHAYFYNCAITGSTKDEIVGEQIENAQAAFNVNFLNCLVNIKLTGEEGEGIQQMFATSLNEVAPFHAKDSTKVKDDDIVWGKKNFKEINNEIYYYDFRLDSLSQARGIGNGDYVKFAPVDRLGKQRPTSKPDAGCYQYN
ncbi:MAG: hypothetical protein J6T52_07960 [Bacteroidaceae bacterium]|nr:hypothetical protein [Bacteroidaceae bacterium]